MFKFETPYAEGHRVVHIPVDKVVAIEFTTAYDRIEAWVTLTNDNFRISPEDAERLIKAVEAYEKGRNSHIVFDGNAI
mgnify:CR=1 FL=1